MALAASIAEPPPIAIIHSGSNSVIFAPPARQVLTDGSGSTPSIIKTSMPAFSSWSFASSRKPNLFIEEPPVTRTAFLPLRVAK